MLNQGQEGVEGRFCEDLGTKGVSQGGCEEGCSQ